MMTEPLQIEFKGDTTEQNKLFKDPNGEFKGGENKNE
jgi:hypothetical protein